MSWNRQSQKWFLASIVIFKGLSNCNEKSDSWMKFDCDSFRNQILNFLVFFSLTTFDISTRFLVLSFTLWIMSFNSHSIAEWIGWDTTWQRYTHGQKDGMRTNGHGKTRLASFIFELLLATNTSILYSWWYTNGG